MSDSAADLEALVVDLIARDAVKVPPYPAVAMRLQKLIMGGNFGIQDVVKLTSEDQSLSANLLRIANSPNYRGVDKITSLQAAVGRIGGQEVGRIALALSVGAQAAASGALATLRRKAWRQSLAGAVLCHHLAIQRKFGAEEAFVCGLLHDFGRVLAVAAFEELLAQKKDTHERPESEWTALIDRFHVELGIVTAARWNLPDLLASVISAHHQPALAGVYKPMVDVVIASDAIVALIEANPSITVADLGGVALSDPEKQLITQLAPKIPGFIASLDEVAAAAPEPAQPPRSQVAHERTKLQGSPKTAAFPGQILKADSQIPFEAAYATHSGLAFRIKDRIKENNVARLKIEPAGAPPFEFFVNVIMCAPDGAGHLAEGKLFALDGEAKSRWDKLFAALA